jgi:UDP-N-acetylmuramoylalanine--D-glutamate ligase
MGRSFTIHKGKKSQVENFIHARARMLEELKSAQHRLEEVDEIDSVLYVNDSSATSVMSTLDSIRCVSDPIVWILTATPYDRDFILLSKIVRHKVKAIIVLGFEAQDVRSAIGAGVDEFIVTEDMDQAVLEAKGIAKTGDVVLFSPSAPAGRFYTDVNQRGEDFKEKVSLLRGRL